MDIKSEQIDGVAILELNGSLTADTVEDFNLGAAAILEEHNRLLLDLSRMDYIDSTGLGALVALLQKVSEHGGKLALAGLQPKPQVVFDITRAVKVFNIYRTVEEARDALAL